MLDAGARDPTRVGLRKARTERGAGDSILGRIVDVGPGDTPGSIEQRAIAVECNAGAAAYRGQPIVTVAAVEAGGRAHRGAVNPGPGGVGLGAEDELAHLYIIADL